MAEVDLPTLINAATRKQHTELNRLIIERLPLALPPNAIDPTLLGQGIAVFARIYITFEAAWDELILRDEKSSSKDGYLLRQSLVDLHIDQLCRTNRLKEDIEHIGNITGQYIQATLETQQQPMLDSMLSAIRAKPHILIAYAWIMYMAIFSGGRWIRAQLANSGPGFWAGQAAYQPTEKTENIADESRGFSFLRFDGDRDGEDIKADFKTRLKAANELLTQDEKDDIVQAARVIFDDCIMLVHMLDSDMQRPRAKRTWLWVLLGVAGSAATLLRIFVRSFT